MRPSNHASRRIVVGHELEDVLPEQEPDFCREVGDRPGLAGARTEAGIHRGERLLVRKDRHVGERDVAMGVIEVAVGVDDGAQRLAGLRQHRAAQLAASRGLLLGVDDDDAVRSLDRARIGVAAGADPGMHAPCATVTRRASGFCSVIERCVQRSSCSVCSLPPCGGGSGWGVGVILRAPSSQLRPPPPTPPHKGEGEETTAARTRGSGR